jgi:carbon-monoxide dehydrogenase medium subunit
VGVADIKYLRPQSLTEALEMLSMYPEFIVFAGGTDLVPNLNLRKLRDVKGIVYLGSVRELKGISDYGDHIYIGALTTHAEIASSELIKRKAPNLWYASYHLGTPAVRNQGTIGGNLVNASPAADGSVALMASGAILVLKSATRNRSVPVEEFFVGKNRTILEPGEVLCGIRIPKPPEGHRKGCSFQRIGTLKGASTAIANVAVEIETREDGSCTACRVALGAVAPTPIRLRAVEGRFKGRTIDASLIVSSLEGIDEFLSPIDDTYATAWYRRRVVKVILRRALEEAAGLSKAIEEV